MIEVLLAVMVMGISSVAILLAFGTSIFGSSEYRGLSTTDTVLRSTAEEVTNLLQAQSGALWADCGGITAINANLASVAVPSGYTLSPLTATYWSSSQDVYFAQTSAELSSNPPSCPTFADTNPSALVTITLTAGANSYNISTVVNDPSAPATPAFGTASKLVFIGQPGAGTAGNTLSAPPEVAIEDVNNQIVTTDLSSVQLSLNSPTGITGASLSGDCSGAEIGGVITFSNCAVSEADFAGDGGYSLTATDPELPGQMATSHGFYVSAGSPAQLVFTTNPGNGTGGSPLSTEPQVSVEDAYGDVVTNDNSSLALSIEPGTGTSGAQATAGCSTPTETAGIFSFTNCGVNLIGTGYVFVATDGSMTANSGSFNVTAGPAAGLAFTTQPSASDSTGVTFSTQPKVSIADLGGNAATSATATPVTISLATGITGVNGAGTLGCPTAGSGLTVSTSTVTATFSACKITLSNTAVGGTFELMATATYGGHPYTAYSQPFTVAASSNLHLMFTTAPGASSSGTIFTTQPVVEVVDANNDLVTSSSASITLQDTTTPGAHQGSVTCPGGSVTVTAVNGVASFSNCEVTLSTPVVNNEGTFTLEAYSSSSLLGYTNFTVAGPATQLDFVTTPGNSTSATAFGTQPVVQVWDQAGDLVTNSSATVTLLVNTGSGTVGCPTGTSVTAIGGIATFSGCQITLSSNSAEGAFTLKAQATVSGIPISGTTPTSFTVAGPATKLVFTTQPSNGTGGANLVTQPQVTVEDLAGDVVTADSSTVVPSLNSPGSSGASLSDTCAGTESLGVVTFSGCSVNQAGNGYTITATDGSLTPATSSPFNIVTGTASQLVFITSPQGGLAGQAFGVQPVVAVEDAGGNLITTGSPRSIALTITGGAPLTCTSNTATTSGGIATFTGCLTTSAGANLSLSATTSGFPVGVSTTFNISPGPASVLAITSSPVAGQASQQANLGPITVQQQDSYGNPVLAGASNLQVTLASSSTAGVFSDIGGTPTGPSITIPYGLSSTTFYYGDTNAGTPTVSASATGLSIASETQTIVPAPASQLVITSSAVSGAASATANLGPITVQEQDPFGNPSPAGSGGQAVTLAATGTATFAPSAGGSGATSATIPAGSTSVPFYFGDQLLGTQTITASAFGTQVTQGETIGASLPSASLSTAVAGPVTYDLANNRATSTVTVTLKDAFGNAVANKAVSLTPGAGSSIVTPVLGTTNGSGVATFTATDTVAQSVTYTAKDTTDGITLSTTPTVTFIAGPVSASHSTVAASPISVSANGTSASTITVTAKDINNNPEIGDTVVLNSNVGTSSLITTLSGTTNASGQATFSVSDNAAEAVTYTATANGVTLGQTAVVTFVSDPASVTNSTVVASPTTGVTANGTATSTITVTIKDGAATPLPISNQTVTLSQGSGSSVITTVSGTTNSSGIATFTVKDTHAQPVIYTATDTTEAVTVGMTATVTFVAGPASASNSTVVASPTSLTTSNLTTSTVTVTALDANGNPEIGDSITLTQGSGLSVITTSPATTNSSGVATFTVKDTHTQAVIYTATDTTDGVQLNQTPTVTFTTGAPSASVSTVVASLSSVKANGTSATTVTVTDTDAYGNPVIGDTITLTQAGGASVITTSPSTTNSSGVATFTVADNTAQIVTYTAKDTTANVTFNQTAPVTFTADAASATNSTAVAVPATGVTANGAATSTITVTIKDGSATPLPIANQTVTLTQGTGSSLITTVSGTTNSSGQATFTVTNTTAQTVTYTATDTTGTAVQVGTQPTVAFVAGPASPSASNSTVAASPITQLANGTSYSTITVTAKDANNNPEINDTITLAQGGGASLITTVSGTTNSSGIATFTVADNATQAVTYTATDVTDSVTLAQTATVTFTSDPASAANSTAVATPATGVTANGTATSTITVTIKDGAATPNPIANQTVTLTQGSGSSVITTVSGTTNSSGVATFTVTDTHAQTVTYTATDTTGTAVQVTTKPTVAFVAGPVSASVSTVVASPTTGVTANGTATSTITVTALDANGNPVAAQSVSLAASPSTGATITTSPTTTNSSGVAQFVVKDTVAGSVFYTATDITQSLALTQTPTVTFVPGLASATVSTAVATQATNVIDTNHGGTGTTITVTIKDANGNAISGQSVTLTATGGGGTSTITTSPTTTNASGVAQFAVKYSNTGTETYTATDTTGTAVQLTTQPTVTYIN